mgnify:FL=1
MIDKASPPSSVLKDCICAFLVGGAICLLGQVLTNLFVSAGIEAETAKTVSTISLVFLSALSTACRFYDNIARHAGAGTLVPITGFANAIVSPAMEFKSEGLVIGTGVKMFNIAGPVIVYGTTASVIYGIILWIIGMF